MENKEIETEVALLDEVPQPQLMTKKRTYSLKENIVAHSETRVSSCVPMGTVKRSLERRDVLTLLLAAPARMLRENDGMTAVCRHDRVVRRLAAHLNDGKVNLFPSYELESILRALAEECNRARDPPRIRSIVRPPHKRPRVRPVNNNLHSILRFVERVIHQRYEERPECHDTEDNDLLDDELKRYFGARELSFQIEEDILSLAFEIALDAVVQSVEDEGPNARSSTDDENKSDVEVPPVQSIIGFASDGVIETALRIIDSTVHINRRMRAKLDRLQETQRRGQISFDAKITDRRKKYEHLLTPKTWRHDNGQNSAKHPATHVGVISIMEENYSQQWEWLHRMRTTFEEKKLSSMPTAASASVDVDFVIVRRKIETLDDISLSSNDSDEEMNDESDRSITTTRELYLGDLSKPDTKVDPSSPIPEQGSELAPHAASDEPTPDAAEPVVSPFERLDLETHQLRLALLDMSPGESSSAEVVRHTVGEVASLLGRYGDLDGAAGIARCGDVLGGGLAVDAGKSAKAGGGENPKRAAAIVDRFPLNDAAVSSLAAAFLTDATGALRARAFLRSFVLPLMTEMNPTARAMSAAKGGPAASANDDRGGKPASRALMSLLSSLSRERPMECVVSVIVPSLVIAKPIPPSSSPSSFEPTRFQCELISRVLRGRDSLTVPAIALLVREVLPPSTTTSTTTSTTKEGGGIVGADDIASRSSPLGGGMKWTESTMPLLTACLNCRPTLTDDVVAALADGISRRLSSPSKNDGASSAASSTTMTRSIQFSTLFHALVTKYGTQLKSARRVSTLLDSASRLGTFMSRSICLALKKLS